MADYHHADILVAESLGSAALQRFPREEIVELLRRLVWSNVVVRVDLGGYGELSAEELFTRAILGLLPCRFYQFTRARPGVA